MTTQTNNVESQIQELQQQIRLMQLQQQLQQMQQSQQQGQQVSGSPTNGNGGSVASQVHKRGVRLEAATVKASIGGQMTGILRATLRDTDGEALQDKEIVFLVATTRQEVGRADTNARGVAEVSAGSNGLDPILWAEALATGWIAVFSGNREFLPAEAKATVHLSIA
ncbi:hypothetical protein ABZZ79_39165 [Streptomyces sp. NPDC006458]|uniref:hypothetical protein n=1 Tax=Streptomyces sp. NPDC006458 TaxID=3154302 RepID=UPI0033A4DC53